MHKPINRRAIVAGAIAAGTLVAPNALARSNKPHEHMATTPNMPDHAHMDHSKMSGGREFTLTRDEERAVRALATCESAGQVCLSQCIEALASGDTSMAACAWAVRTMLAVCGAAKTLVQTHSTFAGQQLALCRDVCVACASECAKHKAHHQACGNCASACEDAVEAIDRLLG